MKFAIFVAPGTALMDLAPAHTLFSMIPDSETHTVWKTRETLNVMPGAFPFQATTTFDECPKDLDVIFVPAVGARAHNDSESLNFLADRGSRARWVTSVCGGALMLAAAGLLDGYRTATHWAYDDLLPKFGAIVTSDRVVVDRNRITSDGGSASVEHALVLAKHLIGDSFARDLELIFEWDPQPINAFGTGSPEKAGTEMTKRVLRQMEPLMLPHREILERAASSRQMLRP